MPKFKIETYLKIIFLISILSIISAYFIEYILGFIEPCQTEMARVCAIDEATLSQGVEHIRKTSLIENGEFQIKLWRVRAYK